MKLEYKIFEDGYEILNNGKVWISQRGAYAPSGDYEEEAKKAIAEIEENEARAEQEKTAIEELQEQVTDLQMALTEAVEGGML